MKKIFKIIILVSLFSKLGFAAENEEIGTYDFEFEEFFQNVMINNLELIIEQYDVSIAEAAVVASRVFPDPEIEFLLHAFEDSDNGFRPTIEIEMEIPLELFGKRRYRIREAQAEAYAQRAQLEDFLRYLRADAGKVFAQALLQQALISRMNIILDELQQLVDANSARYDAGEIGRMDLLQTKLELNNYKAEVFEAKAEYNEIISDVYYLIGGIPEDSLILKGNLDIDPPLFVYEEIKQKTLNTRADILFAERMVQASEHSVSLARAERLPDISLMGGFNNEDVHGIRAAYVGLVIPLKFSGFNRGEFEIAYNQREQSKLMLEATLLDAEIQLKATYNNFLMMLEKKSLFTESILIDAETVIDAAVYSYERGEASLLEVLEAQRTMNEIYMNYYEALLQYSKAVIDLSKASGEWFVKF